MTDPSPDRLAEEGWTRQFVADEPRLREAAAAYEEAGFEVRLEPLPPESECGECRACFDGSEDRYRIIYTRPRNNPPSSTPEDDLFD